MIFLINFQKIVSVRKGRKIFEILAQIKSLYGETNTPKIHGVPFSASISQNVAKIGQTVYFQYLAVPFVPNWHDFLAHSDKCVPGVTFSASDSQNVGQIRQVVCLQTIKCPIIARVGHLLGHLDST